MKKLKDRIYGSLNNSFGGALADAFYEQFHLEFKVSWSIIDMATQSRRVDGKKFTRKQYDFIKTYESAYLQAMQEVYRFGL